MKLLTPQVPGYLPPDKRPLCRYCGKAMRAVLTWDLVKNEETGAIRLGEYANVRVLGWGYKSDGLFCSASCGYEYGCRAVRNREDAKG